MLENLADAYAPQPEVSKGATRTLLYAVLGFMLLLAVGMGVFAWYVGTVREDIGTSQSAILKSRTLADQGRAVNCFIAATQTKDLKALPGICMSEAVLRYYDPQEAQRQGEAQDTQALKDTICLIVPSGRGCDG